jgi:hypothetical protein
MFIPSISLHIRFFRKKSRRSGGWCRSLPQIRPPRPSSGASTTPGHHGVGGQQWAVCPAGFPGCLGGRPGTLETSSYQCASSRVAGVLSYRFVSVIRVTSKSADITGKVSTNDRMQLSSVPRDRVQKFSTVLAAYISSQSTSKGSGRRARPGGTVLF